MLIAFVIAVLLQAEVLLAAHRQWLAAILITPILFYLVTERWIRSDAIWENPPAKKTIALICAGFAILFIATYRFPMHSGAASAQSGHKEKGAATNEKADRGILLRPKVQRISLIPPQPRLLQLEDPVVFRKKDDLIPFTGVYWIFQPPDFTLPINSPEVVGSPDEFKFRSTDGTEVRLEAHQIFDPPLAYSSVGDLEVEIRTTDEQPSSFRMFLTLRDARLGPAAFVSYPPMRPIGTAVRFPKVQSSVITHFDQLTLRLIPDSYRWSRVPRIGIVGFRLR